MTNKNLTSINVILDESPSMGSLRDATIEGFNAFLTEQARQPTLAQSMHRKLQKLLSEN